MSTYWGYVCLSHTPALESERWWNHGDAALVDLYTKMREGSWPIVTKDMHGIGLAFEGEPFSAMPGSNRVEALRPRPGGGAPPWSGPPAWLMEHPLCKVGIRSEYGETRELP